MTWFDLIKRVMFVVAICLVGIAATSLFTQKISSPGATGMNSNSGVQEIRITDARYLENINNHETAGVLKKRNSLVVLNSTDRRIDGAFGYFDEASRKKLIVGVIHVDSLDSIYLYSDSISSWYWARPDGVWGDSSVMRAFNPIFWMLNMKDMGLLRVSDSFSSIITTGTPDDTALTITIENNAIKPQSVRRKYVSWSGYHDFTVYKDMLIHSDGRGIPTVFTARNLDWDMGGSPDTLPDTIIYSPRFLPLGLPRPGELILNVIDTDADTKLYGRYTYAYTFKEGTSAGVWGPMSDTSYNSIVVYPKNQAVMLTGFLPTTNTLSDTTYGWPDSMRTQIYLFRKNWDHDAGSGTILDSIGASKFGSNWILVDVFSMMNPDEVITYIDTGQISADNKTLEDYDIWSGTSSRFIDPPGRPQWNRPHMPYSDSTCSLTVSWEERDTSVAVAYSFYDPITELESPLSYGSYIWPKASNKPIVYSYVTGTSDSQFYPVQYSLGHLNKERCPTDWIRIYRNVLLSTLTGAGDTTVFYCIAQVPIEQTLQSWEGVQIILGMVPDSMFSNSEPVDFSKLDLDYVTENVSDSYLTHLSTDRDSLPYTNENNASTSDGEVIIRPPYIASLRIPFTDMEYASSRLWGIGDPLYPQRLYYSGLDDINDWNPIQYLSLDEGENDELVAIEKIEGPSGDVMYGLKRNSVYLISGYDPEYDLSIFRLSDKIGADSRFTVIKGGTTIYFMTPNQRIYALFNNQLEWISYPIQDYCDTAFAHTDSIRTFLLEDKVVFAFPYGTSDTNNYASYHPLSKSWSIDTYSDSLEPYGSIQYDTLQNTTGFNDDSYWIFERDSLGAYFYYEDDALYDSFPTSIELNPYHYKPLVYGTPEIGDGENLFQIMSYQATIVATGSQNIIASVRNRAGTELVADTISANANTYQDYTFTFPTHIGKYLSVRISGNYITEIDDISIRYRRVGRGKTY